MNNLIGSIPSHKYIYVDSRFICKQDSGFIPAVWFGLVSFPGRAWGLNVLLESGAVYRSLPPHAISFTKEPAREWTIQDSQTWDCYGRSWSAEEYTYLAGMRCKAKAAGNDHHGRYLFTVAPIADAFSSYPEQSKEFSFIELDNGRITIQPTNHILFRDDSFTTWDTDWPKGLKRQTEVYRCES